MCGRPAGRWVTLCYHAVDADQRRRFERQMAAIASRVRSVSSLGEPMPRGSVAVGITFDDGFACILDTAVPVLSARRLPAVVFAVAGNLGRAPAWRIHPQHPDAGRRVLSAAELRQLPDTVRVGSHTWSHPRLDRLPAARARRELADSKRCLEDLTGRPVTALAFPHGAYSEETVRLARECGYVRLFTIEPCAYPGPLPFGLVGRVEVTADDPLLVFRMKASTACEWMFRLRQAKRAIIGGREWESVGLGRRDVHHCHS